MQIKRFRSRLIQANCYLVSHNNQGIIIDPSVSFHDVVPPTIKLTGIFITHGHFDHISELGSYLNNCDAVVYLHENAYPKLIDSKLNCSSLFSLNIKYQVPQERLEFISDVTEPILLDVPIRVIETPGHTDCSICLLIADMLFTGDTLFKDSVGRADLPGSASEEFSSSLFKLKRLNPALTVYPGHGDSTTLGREIAENPYMPR